MKWFLQVAMIAIYLTACFTLEAQDHRSEFQSTTLNNANSQIANSIFSAIEKNEKFNKQRPFQKFKKASIDKSILKDGILAEIDPQFLNDIYRNAPDYVEIELPNEHGESQQIFLQKTTLYSETFRVTSSSSGGKSIPAAQGIHYHGIIENETSSIVALSFFEGEMIGMVSTETGGRTVIHPSTFSNSEYLIYKDSDLNFNPDMACGTDLLTDHPLEEINPNKPESNGDCVKVFIECDHALYLNKGSVVNTTNYISAIFNNVAALYANENITVKISEIFVWTSPDAYSTTNSVNALYQFRSARQSFNGDIAHLAALGGQNIGGVAWLNGLCSSYKYGYSNIHASYQNVPIYSWNVEVITHEIGHNLGSNHTQWCGWLGGPIDNCYNPEGTCNPGPAPTNGGTIMSYCHLTPYGINFANGFGILPGNAIRNKILNATCLSSCESSGGGTSSCGVPESLTSTNITQTSAIINWNAITGATNYKLEYKASTASTWSYITTTSASYALTNLFANMNYQFRVQANCGTTSGSFSATNSFNTLQSAGYCESKGLSSEMEWIEFFKITTLENYSGNNNGYLDVSKITNPVIGRGKVIQIYFSSGQVNLPRRMYWRVWIDYNQNGNFADAGELLVSGYSSSLSQIYVNTLIPTTAKTGKTRLRIAMKYGGLPNNCEIFTRGEVEDYTVDIQDVSFLDNKIAESKNDFLLTPNPASDELRLQFQSLTEQKCTIIIVSQTGVLLGSKSQINSIGQNFLSIPIEHLDAGIYFIEFQTEGIRKTQKFIKI